ncbi:MAG: magnesium transporter CorA family protein [bacterium]
MLNKYISKENGSLQEISAHSSEKGCWFNLINPTAEEIKTVAKIIDISSLDFLKTSLDEEERPHIEIDDNSLLIIINAPLMESKNIFDTLPLGIIITLDYFITVCLKENKVLSYFSPENAKYFDTSKKAPFILQILFRSTKLYLKYLRDINQQTDEIEMNLRKSMKNKALFDLLELEKSLVYFTTALKDNGIVMEKLSRLFKNKIFMHLLKVDEEEKDFLEDIIIENKQAIEMVEIHSNILSSMMDAFASIISNNLNIVMKFLTTMTILLAIPTMIASFWGMNVNVPWGETSNGFVYISVFAVIVTSITIFMLWKKTMF